MIIAGMVFAFNISSIRETLLNLNQAEIMEHNFEAILNHYMKKKRISIKTQEKVNDYFQYIWKQEKNRNREIEDMLIQKLAPDLKLQLQYETYIQFVNCRIFYMMYFSNDFLYQLTQYMEEHTCGTKEEIQFEDSQGDQYLMYSQNKIKFEIFKNLKILFLYKMFENIVLNYNIYLQLLNQFR